MSVLYYILLIIFPLTGGLIGYRATADKRTNINILLAFAGAYLLSIVLFHLIPHLYHEINVLTGVFLLVGFFFQVFLERFSRGIEHGHLHLHDEGSGGKIIPYQILISLALHSFMEGMPLGSNLLMDDKSRLSFLIGIVLHELPAAFAMVSILKANHLGKQKLGWFIVIYSCMSAIGAASSNFLRDLVNERIFEYLMAFVVGTFLHIATTILFENSSNHRFSWGKIFAIIAGICFAALVSI